MFKLISLSPPPLPRSISLLPSPSPLSLSLSLSLSFWRNSLYFRLSTINQSLLSSPSLTFSILSPLSLLSSFFFLSFTYTMYIFLSLFLSSCPFFLLPLRHVLCTFYALFLLFSSSEVFISIIPIHIYINYSMIE